MLTYDPDEAVATLAAADKKLAKVIAKAGPFTMRPKHMQSPFQALMRSIVYQQLSGRAAETIHGRVEEVLKKAGGVKPATLAAVDDEHLRAAGMSRAKVAALKDLAAKTIEGVVPTLPRLRKMDDEEIISRLVEVRGVGRWTVEMLLMFRLGRPDVLPVSDLGVRKGFMIVYKTPDLPSPEVMHARADRWRPFRSVASWYLWRAIELHEKPVKSTAK
jgi:DNA-3-methyladenine glycosylase II